MLSIRAIWAYIARGVVHKAVSFHFVLALEAFAADGSLAAFDGAVVWAFGGVDVHVGAIRVSIASIQKKGCTVR